MEVLRKSGGKNIKQRYWLPDFLGLQLRLENLLFIVGTSLFTYLTWRELQSWDVNF